MRTYRFTLPLSALGLVMATISKCHAGDLEYTKELFVSYIDPRINGSEEYCDLGISAKFYLDIESIVSSLDMFKIDYKVN